MAHEGSHYFHMPDEDPSNDRDPDIARCLKEDDQGKRCTYRRPKEEIDMDRVNVKRIREGREEYDAEKVRSRTELNEKARLPEGVKKVTQERQANVDASKRRDEERLAASDIHIRG